MKFGEDRFTGFVVLIFALLLFATTFAWNIDRYSGASIVLQPTFFPRVVLSLILLVCILMIFSNQKKSISFDKILILKSIKLIIISFFMISSSIIMSYDFMIGGMILLFILNIFIKVNV
ncbi:MAG: hypothetical protein ACOWWR_02940, partial [Eubacteriales bacterium]